MNSRERTRRKSPGKPPLGTTVNNSDRNWRGLDRNHSEKASRTVDRKHLRDLQRVAQAIAWEQGEDKASQRVGCGRRRWSPLVDIVAIRRWNPRRGDHYTAHPAGLVSCNSVWECPRCMQRRQLQRAAAVHTLVTGYCAKRVRWRRCGGEVWLLTLTVRHHKGHTLRELRDLLNDAWDSMRGPSARNFRRDCGIEWWLRRLEVTHGANGWHPHLHVLLWMKGRARTDKARLKAIEDHFWRHWSHAIRSRGYDADRDHGIDLRMADKAGRYLVKMGLAMEIADAGTKSARNGNRTPLEILQDHALEGDPADAATWWQYCQTMRGSRQLTQPQVRKRITRVSIHRATTADQAWRRVVAEHGSEQFHRLSAATASPLRWKEGRPEAATSHPVWVLNWKPFTMAEIIAQWHDDTEAPEEQPDSTVAVTIPAHVWDAVYGGKSGFAGAQRLDALIESCELPESDRAHALEAFEHVVVNGRRQPRFAELEQIADGGPQPHQVIEDPVFWAQQYAPVRDVAVSPPSDPEHPPPPPKPSQARLGLRLSDPECTVHTNAAVAGPTQNEGTS